MPRSLRRHVLPAAKMGGSPREGTLGEVMNKDDSKPLFRTITLSFEAEQNSAGGCNDARCYPGLETVALYREIYRRNLVRREPSFWSRLLGRARKVGPSSTSPIVIFHG